MKPKQPDLCRKEGVEQMSTKSKSVDLGALQDDFIKAKAKHQSDIKAFINAEAALDRSRDAFGLPRRHYERR